MTKDKFTQNDLEIICNVLNKLNLDYFITNTFDGVIIKLKNNTITIWTNSNVPLILSELRILNFRLSIFSEEKVYDLVNRLCILSNDHYEKTNGATVNNIQCQNTEISNRLIKMFDKLDLKYYQSNNFCIIIYINNNIVKLTNLSNENREKYFFRIVGTAYNNITNYQHLEFKTMDELHDHLLKIKNIINKPTKGAKIKNN